MSAKWRALQHRHRCTYSALIFPQYFIDSLNLLPSDISSLKFFTELKELISLNSTYSQVEHVKKVTSSFGELLSSSGDVVVSEAARFYLEIPFLENSQPLHKTLVSVLARARDHQSLIASCIRSLCDEYGVLGSKGKRFSVCRVALSLMSCPKLGFLMEIVKECSVSVALDVAFGINAVVSETEGGYRPSPIVMEQCQEALSCLYYLLQRFPSRFTDPVGCRSSLIPEDSTISEIVMKSIIRILNSPAFSRDCWVAAGVSFCAALQAYMNPQELALFLVKVFYHQTSCSISGYENEFRSSDSGLPYKGNLCLEIEEFSVLGRLCLLRGILTAIPRVVLNTRFILSKDSLEDVDFHGNRNDLIWTILFDGILSELCSYCEDPIDSHFNFHVLTVLQICFQQIKTSILAGLVNRSENYDPLPENTGTRILRIIWNNLEDPLSQTVKQVHLIFDLLLDIQSTLPLAEGSEVRKSFIRKTAGDLLRLGGRCKGRYVPLASLTKRLGAKTLLDMSPNLLFETAHAYVDDDVCCAATSFFKCFLECLRDECWSSYGVERGYVIFRGHCLPPVLYGLVSGVSKLRSNLNTYALPVLLEVDVDSIFAMLAFISGGSGDKTEMFYPELSGGDKDLMVDQQVAALVSLMKVSRLLALIEGDIDWYHGSSVLQEEDGLETEGCDHFAFVCIKGRKVKVIVEWLVLALTHVDETLRIDAAESLFLNAKTSTLPSALELNLMKEAVPLNMRCSSKGFQMKWTSLFRKFFARAKTALERQFKEGRWQPLRCSDNYKMDQDKGNKENMVDRAQNLFCFMKWLSTFLFFSCYPSAPYERKIMAMELILIMINVWSIIPNSQGMCSSISPATCLYPYSEGFTLPDSTLLLVGSIVDSWDRLRECSFRILLNFPTPLPGISSQDTVKEVITWAKRLVCSPRVRESDAGALTLRLIFRKYVLELGWTVGALVNVVPHNSQYKLINGDTSICRLKFPVIDYILSLIDWLHIAVEEGEKDLSEACKNSFVHGILLTLRYTFDELDWNSNIVLSSCSGMKVALDKLLELIMRITSLALWVVSADAWCLPEDLDDVVDETFLSDEPVEMDVAMSSPELQVNNSKLVDNVKQAEQVVMVGSWLAMKEVSLLLGTIIRKIPLPSCASSDSTEHGEPVCEAIDVPLVTTSDAMLDIIQLEKIGNHFLEILLKLKHNGAIDKTRAGFTALCNRLLCSNDPRLCKMTESWMEQLMERTVAKGQTVDDLLRRSAGIPAAFIALFLSEPEGTPKKLLPRALKWLIDVANMSLTNSSGANSQQAICAPPILVDVSENNSKIRDEGVIPMVHAFNVLKASFNDTNLAADTSGFCAEALIVSIRSFSSQYWEVRNSACLAYTALVRRMIGFLNVHKRESARRALTGLEFFHRYPVLHPFLFNELKIATEFLVDESSEHSGSSIAKVVHPSLCPMLILLSRLKPSPLSSENEDGLDPFLFMPFIRRCSTQSNLRVRVLASRALAGLVSNEKLPNVLLNIANELSSTHHMTSNSISTSSVNRIDGIHMASFNSIHGMLLQFCSLLDNNCRNLSDVSKKGRILGDLIQVLMTCSWIGNPRLCPCPILNCSFLQVLDHMLSVVRTCRSEHYGSIRSLLLELSLQCLDAEVSHGTPFYDPTKIELRRQAAVSYFNCIFQASTDAGDDLHMKPQRCYPPALDSSKAPKIGNAAIVLEERLTLSLSDTSYEVRLATLKWLLKFLKATGAGVTNGLSEIDAYIVHHWSKTYLQPSLMQILAVEENPRCTYYILRILFSWNLLQFQKSGDQCKGTIYVGGMDYDTIFEFWNNLLSLNKCARHLKTRETILCCMGICVKQFSCLFKSSFPFDLEKKTIDSSLLHQPEKCASILGCINSFIVLIKKHSAASEPVNMRKAAAEAIVASGLLAEAEYVSSFVSNTQIPSEEKCPHFDPSEAADTYAYGILDLWFTCIRLLEDEDVGLRQSLAEDVQMCFTLKASGRSQQNGVVPTQVEKVIEASFEFLSSIFGHWIVYFNYLSNLVLDTASCTLTRGDLVRRVFDKEIDNHHEDKLLICQICCFHLEKLPISKSWAVNVDKEEVMIFLQKRRLRFYHHLVSFSGDYLGVHDGVDWIGGMGNHKDTFISLYANLLGLYALSQCLFNEEAEIGVPLLPDLVELGGTIRPFVRNPLISNLYSLVIQLHERKLGVVESFGNESRGDSFIWEGFDPYFLLR
ncbi:thyroid adenoma-associated protein homolog [Macadamia integrifolia]|uniref:thyroid adenoma-associated protein homolog n=1 Tax=Macadamia integrifolia TaxID=60698 RepID=UPI001C500D16|nr:thyroid adenoma-associated protein homolog [Macadamia integrifolia]XP_042498156.1 thyroid adenoma-associated protein homolog [Macadamia integrifolia]XP_042498157.1 thyroid adenoma-associated protein homolog [Macadamia integrifolia]